MTNKDIIITNIIAMDDGDLMDMFCDAFSDHLCDKCPFKSKDCDYGITHSKEFMRQTYRAY